MPVIKKYVLAVVIIENGKWEQFFVGGCIRNQINEETKAVYYFGSFKSKNEALIVHLP